MKMFKVNIIIDVKWVLISSLLTVSTVLFVIKLSPLVDQTVANQVSFPRTVHLLQQSLTNARPFYLLDSNSTPLPSIERDHDEKRTPDSLNHHQDFIKVVQKMPTINTRGSLDSKKHSLTLPVPYATLPANKLLQQQWVRDLQQILLNIP